MDDVINKDELFGDKYKAFVLCEYTRELELITAMGERFCVEHIFNQHSRSNIRRKN